MKIARAGENIDVVREWPVFCRLKLVEGRERVVLDAMIKF